MLRTICRFMTYCQLPRNSPEVPVVGPWFVPPGRLSNNMVEPYLPWNELRKVYVMGRWRVHDKPATQSLVSRTSLNSLLNSDSEVRG